MKITNLYKIYERRRHMLSTYSDDYSLLKTKYSIPKNNRYIVSRVGLHKKLDNSLNHKLTTVTAPSGYGKTAAVLEWVEKSGLAAAWFSADENDNDPSIFWQYICAALDDFSPGIIRDTEYVFSSQELLSANIHLNVIIDKMSEIDKDFILIIDDMHLITNSCIMNGLSILIDYLPARMHIIIIGRTEPGLDLTKYELKSQLLRISTKDLRFSENEITEFFRIHNHTLKNSDVKMVERYTEGWAAALAAINMSLEENTGIQEVIAGIDNCSKSIYQYLMNEVIDAWPMDKKMFILKTAILDTLNVDLCNTITDDNNGRRFLSEMSKRNEFLELLDDKNTSYRYHQLFKDFLGRLLEQSIPGLLPELHEKAAEWYLKHGSSSDAIEHYLSGKLYDKAFTLIEQKLGPLASENAFSIGFSWINRLPEPYKDKSIKVCTFYSLYYAEQNQFELSREWVDKASHLMSASNTGEFGSHDRSIVNLTLANLLLREGKFDKCSLPDGYQPNVDNYKSIEYYDFNRADIYFYRCPVHAWVNQIVDKDNALPDNIIEDYRKIAVKNPGYITLALGERFYEKNMIKEALPYLVKALELGQSANCAGVIVPAMVNICRIRKSQGDMQGALSVLDECESRLKSINKIHWNYLIEDFKTRLYMEMRNIDMADRWISTRKPCIYGDINSVREFELIVYARILMQKNINADAEILLLRLLSYTDAGARLHSKVEILNLLAMLSYKKNDLPAAVDYIERSLSIGIVEGYIRSYIDEHEPIIGVLKQAVTIFRKRGEISGNITAFTKDLILKTQAEIRMSPLMNVNTDKKTINQLTAKEKQVLELLFAANTNEEIGAKLNISLRTVKNHIGNIYSKLEVSNRAQCIKLIREMHLIE
jgi:LuxR family transcriptional regulator, maltose regulon positive regulatory protein